jgi:hypothetical protein
MNCCKDLLTLSNPHPNLPPLTGEGIKGRWEYHIPKGLL